MIEEIKSAVHDAAHANQKIAMFHFQVLKNSVALAGLDPVSFCRDIQVPDSYRSEFTKMLGLARVMQQQGVGLALQH